VTVWISKEISFCLELTEEMINFSYGIGGRRRKFFILLNGHKNMNNQTLSYFMHNSAKILLILLLHVEELK
jgi:hypothetical protein